MKSSLQTGIWLIGIGILAITNFWWPGIMFVIGVSSLVSGSIQTAIWMFGIGVVGYFNYWWPGMIIVVGVSMLAEAIFPDSKKSAEVWQDTDQQWTPKKTEGVAPSSSQPKPQPDTHLQSETEATPDWLPPNCPSCGGPLIGQAIKVHGPNRASCPWCAETLEK